MDVFNFEVQLLSFDRIRVVVVVCEVVRLQLGDEGRVLVLRYVIKASNWRKLLGSCYLLLHIFKLDHCAAFCLLLNCACYLRLHNLGMALSYLWQNALVTHCAGSVIQVIALVAHFKGWSQLVS